MDYDSWKLATPDQFSQLLECEICGHEFDESDMIWNGIEFQCPKCYENEK